MEFILKINLDRSPTMRDGEHIAKALIKLAGRIDNIMHDGLPRRCDIINDDLGVMVGRWRIKD